MSMLQRRYARKIVAIVLLCSLAIGLPSRSTNAGFSIAVDLAKTSNDFVNGKFGLTGLGKGGVQLTPMGVLANWRTNQNGLCNEVGEFGTAVYKQHLYAIGGATGTISAPVTLRSACRTTVINTDGDTTPWQALESENLPVRRSNISVVAVDNPANANQGLLFAFGGRETNASSSRDTIYRSIINPTTGSLTGWVTETLPLPQALDRTAITAYTVNGRTFIYLVGGFSKVSLGPSFVSRKVLRYEVLANGSLVETTPTSPSLNLPIPNNVIPGATGSCVNNVGLLEADAVNFDVVSPDGVKHMIAVMGGSYGIGSADGAACGLQLTTVVNPNTFLGEIKDNGDIIWQQGTDYTMPDPVSQTRAVNYGQKLFLAGGYNVTTNRVTNRVYSGYVNFAYELQTFVNTNYLVSSTALPLDRARAAHGLKIVNFPTGDSANPIRPIVYMFGGIGSSGRYRNDVMYGYVGLDEDVTQNNAGYASPGLFVSNIYTLRAPAALTELKWTAIVSTTPTFATDLRVEYRFAETPIELNSATWIPVDGDPSSANFSKSSVNTVAITAPDIGRYFQYRAFFTTSLPTDKEATPVLRAPISIKYSVDGFPSLYVQSATAGVVQYGQPFNFITTFVNDKRPGTTVNENIIDADIEAEGTFFVDLYAFPPNSKIITPTMNALGQYPIASSAYLELNRKLMTAGTILPIESSSWRVNCGTTACPPANWSVIFNKPGLWTVFIVVDSGNNVKEADTVPEEWEQDNIYRFTVQSEVRGGNIHLPIILINSTP